MKNKILTDVERTNKNITNIQKQLSEEIPENATEVCYTVNGVMGSTFKTINDYEILTPLDQLKIEALYEADFLGIISYADKVQVLITLEDDCYYADILAETVSEKFKITSDNELMRYTYLKNYLNQ